jgi:hypothetical protein
LAAAGVVADVAAVVALAVPTLVALDVAAEPAAVVDGICANDVAVKNPIQATIKSNFFIVIVFEG